MNFTKYRYIYYILSGVLVSASVISLLIFGLRFGIEFKGGSILEVTYDENRPSPQEVRDKLSDLDLGQIIVQPTDSSSLIIRMKDIDEDTHQEVLRRIGGQEARFESIGPTIGKELKQKAIWAIILSVAVVIIYLGFAFRGFGLSSWQYGLIAALVAFFHDALIPIGVMSVLGKWYGVEITIPIIAALLTIIGYSINDTVVILDRLRENILRHRGFSFEDTVNRSLNQTLVRSINTSLTTLLVLIAVFFFGGVTLKYFSLVLIIGITAGTYSSIFLVASILVDLRKILKA